MLSAPSSTRVLNPNYMGEMASYDVVGNVLQALPSSPRRSAPPAAPCARAVQNLLFFCPNSRGLIPQIQHTMLGLCSDYAQLCRHVPDGPAVCAWTTSPNARSKSSLAAWCTAAAVATSTVYWRKLNLKARLESRLSYYNLKCLVPGTFSVVLIGSICTALPLRAPAPRR